MRTYYKGFTITVRPTFGGLWADFDRPGEEYNTRIPRHVAFDAINDAKREIDKITLAERQEGGRTENEN